MTKEQTKIIRLLAKIQNECGKINFNTRYEAIVYCGYKLIDIHVDGRELCHFDHALKGMPYAVDKLESVLAELKEYYKINRIIVKKGEL